MIAVDRWEHGSTFDISLEGGEPKYPWPAHASLWGSGRDAMRGLLGWGRDHHGWERLLCPSYMCQHVAAALSMEIELVAYPCDPLMSYVPEVATGPGDVVLIIAALGMRLEPAVSGPAPIIEDHTHDPLSDWAWTSRGDYVIASLRKTFPLPDGGVLWSPRGLGAPPERPMTARHARATFERLEAMTLKRLYLEGAAVGKDDFRRLFLSGEPKVGNGAAISGISPYTRGRMASLPAQQWRDQRSRNRLTFVEALGQLDHVQVLDTPFVITLVLANGTDRDRLRRELVAERVYPAVYWPQEERVLPGIRDEDIALSRRIVSIHCDQRYTEDDMVQVARFVRTGLGVR